MESSGACGKSGPAVAGFPANADVHRRADRPSRHGLAEHFLESSFAGPKHVHRSDLAISVGTNPPKCEQPR